MTDSEVGTFFPCRDAKNQRRSRQAEVGGPLVLEVGGRQNALELTLGFLISFQDCYHVLQLLAHPWTNETSNFKHLTPKVYRTLECFVLVFSYPSAAFPPLCAINLTY